MRDINMSDSSLGSSESWLELTKALGNDDYDGFKFFRSHPVMLRDVEATKYISLLQNIDFLRNNETHYVTKSLNLICKSDLVGAPLRTYTFKINNELIAINPTTARYAKNWANIIDCFGFETIFQSTKITEIGAGYGGESKIFFDIANSNNTMSQIGEYEIYDLVSSEKLITRFLKEFGYSIKFNKLKNDNQIKKNLKHLVISNGALSEMRGELLKAYINKVVLNANYGYFIVNFDTHSKPFKGGISNTEFFNILKKNGKNPRWLDESIFLTLYDKGASKLIVFGANDKLINSAIKIRKKPSLLKKFIYRIIELNHQKSISVVELIKKVLGSIYHKIVGNY